MPVGTRADGLPTGAALRSTGRRHRGGLEPSRHQNAKQVHASTCLNFRGHRYHLPHQHPRRHVESGAHATERHTCLQDQQFPQHSRLPGVYESPSADHFRCLHPAVLLKVGACVFVNNSVWFRAGVANGAVGGVVVHMRWEADQGGAPEGRPNYRA